MLAVHLNFALMRSRKVRRYPGLRSRPRSNISAIVGSYLTDEQLAVFNAEQSKGCNSSTSRIELIISCKDLFATHIIKNKTDAYCVVLMKRAWETNYKGIGQTETIKNSRNPHWTKKIQLDYNFEIIQDIRFEIRDKGLRNSSEFLGRFDTQLSKLVSCYGSQTIGKLAGLIDGIGYKDCGEITVVTEEVTSCKQMAEIQFRAENLPSSWLRSNKPFLIISRSNEDSSYSFVTNTEAAMDSSKNPMWDPILLPVAVLCSGDFDRCFKIDCCNFKDDGKHKLIGTCYASLHNLNSMCKDGESRSLVNEKKQRTRHGYAPSGVLRVEKINIFEDVTFLDYIRNGTLLHFAVAIDFTASNGIYTDPKSLHYLCDERLNSYELALKSVGEIIQQYDNSKLFPAFGFGAKLGPDSHVSFQFPLNGNPSYPFCNGTEEILKHYRNQVKSIVPFGPTNFSPVINHTIDIASQYQDGKHYFVLLIITDGIISDMRLTKQAIIEASKLPISIIIVGVGCDSDFEAMEELDSDNTLLSIDGITAERDIVQFVEFQRYLTKSGEFIGSQTRLAEEVLAEIPEQFYSYMIWRGFRPQVDAEIPPDPKNIVPTAPLATSC